MTVYPRKPNVIESSSGSESDSDSQSCTSDASSYFSSEDVVELEMFELKCKTVEAAYDKYNSMVKYMCSVMLSQLTTMQKVISLVAPSVDLAMPSSGFDEMTMAAAGDGPEDDEGTANDGLTTAVKTESA